jgi:ABC-2 type transport system permease protein
MRLVRSGLRRLVRRPATWVTFGLLAGLLALIFIAVGATAGQAGNAQAALAARLLVTFPGAYTFILSFILGFGGLLAVTYGAAIAGSEWSWGTLKASVARGESRTIYTLAVYASVAIATTAAIVLAFIVGVGAAAIGATLGGVSLDGMGDVDTLATLPELFARGSLAMAMTAAIGFAVATVAKSQLAGIGVGIGLFFGEQFASLFLGDIVKWFPFDAASAVIAVDDGALGGGGLVPMLDPTTALFVVVAWLVAALAFAAIWTERAEIGG